MAKIPETQRRRLASSLVGTPGLDKSGGFIAEGLGAVRDVVVGSAQDKKKKAEKESERIRLRDERAETAEAKRVRLRDETAETAETKRLRLQAEGDKRATERQKAADIKAKNTKVGNALNNVEADRAVIEYNSSLAKLRSEKLPPDEYEKRAKKLLDDTLEGKAPEVQSRITGNARSATAESFNKNMANDTKRKVAQIKNDFDESLQITSDMVTEIFSDPEAPIEEKLEDFGSVITEYQRLLVNGRDENVITDDEFRKASEGSAAMLGKAASNAIMETSPQFMKQFLEANEDSFTAEEKQDMKAEALDYMERNRQLAEKERREIRFAKGNDISLRMASKDVRDWPTLDEIDQAVIDEDISPSVAAAAKRRLKSSNVNPTDRGKTYNSRKGELALLSKQFSKAFSRKDKIKQKETRRIADLGTFDAGFVPYAQLAEFQAKVLDDMADGNLTPEKGNSLLKDVTPILGESNLEMMKNLVVRTETFSNGDKFVTNLAQESEVPQLAMEFGSELADAINAFEDKKKGRASPAEVRDIFAKAKRSFQIRLPGSDMLTNGLGDIVDDRQGNRVKIIGFDPRGKMIVSSNITDKILAEPFGSTETALTRK